MYVSSDEIICSTETWLTPFVSNSEVFCDEHFVMRADRIVSRGGAATLGIKNSYSGTSFQFK